MPDDPEGDEDKLLEDLVSDAIGSPAPGRRDFPSSGRQRSSDNDMISRSMSGSPRERVVRITPLPILAVLLGGIAVGAFFVYRNIAAFLEKPELPGEITVSPFAESPPGLASTSPPAPPEAFAPRSVPPASRVEPPRKPAPRAPLSAGAPKPVRMPAGDLSVQIGSYASQTYYRRAVREIRRIGYEPVVTRKESLQTSYELRIGPFRELEEAELVFRNLPEHGFNPREMSLRKFRDKGSRDESILYFITLQAVGDQGLLERRAQKVRSLGLPNRVRKEESGNPVRVVRVDHLTRPQAQRLVAKLKEKGYEPKILEE